MRLDGLQCPLLSKSGQILQRSEMTLCAKSGLLQRSKPPRFSGETFAINRQQAVHRRRRDLKPRRHGECRLAVVDVMPFLSVIVTPVAALFVALLESLAGCGEGTAARFAHVARAACLAGLLRIGGRCRGMLGGECERRAEHRHCGRKRRNRDRGWFENSRNLCMCHGHTLCCTVTRSHSLSLVKLTLVKLTTHLNPCARPLRGKDATK